MRLLMRTFNLASIGNKLTIIMGRTKSRGCIYVIRVF